MSIDSRKARKYFPYQSFRPHQLRAIEFIYRVFREGRIGLLSSPCGTGKSISAITAFLLAKNDGFADRALILTRTKNQFEIYRREVEKARKHSGEAFTVAMFKSKKEMCPYVGENEALRRIGYRDFLRYCRSLKSGKHGYTCSYYEKTIHGWKPTSEALDLLDELEVKGLFMPEEIYDSACREGFCPYEVTKLLSRRASLIIGSYNYLLLKPVRRSMLASAKLRLRDLAVVVDEAHGLPRYAVDVLSDEISNASVERGISEVEKYGVKGGDFLLSLRKAMVDLGDEARSFHGVGEEHVVEDGRLIEPLIKGTKSRDLEGFIDFLSQLMSEGEKIRFVRLTKGERPTSHLYRCASFVLDWIQLSDREYIKYSKFEVDRRGRERYVVGIKCLDPSLLTRPLSVVKSAVLMSGTLWNIEYYIEVLGIDRRRADSLILPNPFPSRNLLILVDRGVSTRFERRGPEEWARFADHLLKVIEGVEGRIAIYFPSYDVMWEILRNLKLKGVKTLVEGDRTGIVEVKRFLSENGRCVVFGVVRGKISEGVDVSFEGRGMLSCVVIAGLPYPRKTEVQDAVLSYFNDKFGERGFEYATVIPCVNAVAQSAGRLIRSEKDRGVIILMDSRVAGRFKRRLPEDWRNKLEFHLKIERLVEKARKFIIGPSV